MKLTIEINLDNAAFETDAGDEAARILRKLASKLINDPLNNTSRLGLLDYNGSKVGEAKITK